MFLPFSVNNLGAEGFEPSWPKGPVDFKSTASADSAMPPLKTAFIFKRYKAMIYIFSSTIYVMGRAGFEPA